MTQDIQPFLVSADIKREHIRNKVVEGIQESFPIKSRSKTIHVSDITVQNKDYSPSDQKTAIMEGNSLFEHVKGTITVRDNATGEISDKIKNFTLAKVPWFTPRHTLIVGGNEYSVASMVRPKTGVYARKRANGILEANFNMQGASNFNVTMDPEQGEMQIEYGASKIPLYPILTRAGLTHEDISTAWGKDLADKNRQMAPKNASGVVDRLYNKVVPVYGRDVLKLTTPEDKVKEIFNRYAKATMDPEVNKVTLGMPYSSVTPHVILDASKKVLKIFKNSDEVDDRDNLDFKALYGIDDFFKERIKLDARDIARKASIKIEAKKDLRHAVQSAPFTPGLLKFINTSRLVSVPTQTNPMELIDSSMRITSLGEGGISSERAIPMEARMIHPTQIGAIDPMRTPESFQAGVDVRAAMMLHKDKQGNIYVPMYDVKNGKKLVFIRAGQIQNNVVAFPQQKLEGQVDALVNGVTRKVSASTVQYQIPHSSVMYSPATNLIPFMESNQGNRIIMGSKYQTQALSLVDRDVPNVQSISQTGKPMVTVMAETVNPKSPVDGLITEIDKDYIRIKPDTGKSVVSVHYETNFPLAAKSFLHHTLNVRVGDHVKQGQMLADSNYTKDGQLALGKNLTVAYMPYRGANSNDAVVVSEGAAKKLTSEKMYKVIVARDVDMTFNKDKHQVYYGHEYKRDQYGLVDADGVVKKGAKLNAGDPVVFGLRQSTMTPDDILLGRLHKSLVKPFRNASEVWDHNHTGEVVDVVKTAKRIAITIKVKEPVTVGDKLCYAVNTDILTTTGWKPVEKVTVSDVCYTLNTEGVIELHNPTNVHAYPHGEEMYELKSQQVDLRVTANHSLLVELRGTKTFNLIEARDVIGKRVRHRKDGVWSCGTTPKFFELPILEILETGKGCKKSQKAANRHAPIQMLDWLEFLGIYLANGSTTIFNRKDRNGAVEHIVQLSSDYGQIHSISGDQYAWIQEVIERCGFYYQAIPKGFLIKSKQLACYLSQFGKAPDKYVPQEIFTYGIDASDKLLVGLLGCDGSRTPSGSLVYSSVSRTLIDDVQRLCLHRGWSANFKISPRTNYPETWNTCYRAQVVQSKNRPQVNHGHSKTQSGQSERLFTSEEPVYGLTIPNHTLYVRRNGKPVWSGNSGNFGNKGVVSEIIPDEHMIKDESGKPIDLLVTSAGVVGRINPAQILEAAVGKVAVKTGKPILVENFTSRDNVQYAKDLLKKHGVKDKETVFDPITGKTIPSVFVGNGYYFKAFKSTDVNYSARNIGSYDANLQPTKGGDASSKALGMMEFGALVGHNARNVLLEASTLKSQKNDEFWRALQMGYPTPPPKTSFAADKFMNMLVGAGVKVTRTGSKIALGPLTDHDTMKMSAGEILEPKLVRAKDLKPEKGGLFDPGITGGLKGDRWAHIDLAEPIVNPIFEEPVRRFLGMTGTKLTETIHNQGAGYLKTELNKIDLDKKQAELEDKSKKAKGSDLDSIVKQLKYIKSLKSLNLTPGDAYIISKIPVVPPLVRPVIPGKGGQELIYGDTNPLYRDLLFVNNQLKEVKKAGTMPFEEAKLRPMLHQAVGAVYGVNDPVTTKSLARGHKGFLTYIAGAGSPKYGYFQSKLMKKTQDVAGRGTIVPDSNLGIDEVGLPEDMIWTMYEKFLIRRLVQQGYAPLEAQEMIKARHPLAKEAFMREIKERPVMMNRAPTLHRFNITGAFPVPVAGQTIRVNPFVEIAQNGDYDGDCADCTLEYATCIAGKYVLQSLHIGDFPHNKETKKVTGNKELYEVPANTFVFGYSEKNQRVQLCEVTHFSVHHDLEMVNATLTSGRSVKVSRDHSMFGMNPETGELSRFKAEEGIGWGTPKPRQLFVEQKRDYLTDHCDAPDLENVPMDFNLGWVLGAWAGDGWVGHSNDSPNQVCLAKVDPLVRHTFTQRMFRYKEDASLREYSATHDYGGGEYTSTKIHINNTKLAKWFSGVTEGIRGSHNKKLPSWFMHGKEDFLLGLLSGLLDTDGTVCSVKAKAKNKPQIMATYHTVSRNLAVDVSTLLCLLGIKSRIHPYTKKESPGQEYYNVVISVPDLQKVAGQLQCATESKARVLKELSNITFDPSAPENARWDMLPISGATIQAIRSVQILSTSSCEYVALTKAVKLNRISRSVLNKIREQLGDDLVKDVCGAAWFKNVTNENIIWDFIETVVPLEERQTAWDITVPDGCTFMTSEQIVVYDTMMIHTPVSNAAIEDVKKMTLSNTLYGDKSHSDLFVVPRHESTMGITHASSLDDHNKPIHFATQADAMKAYHDSKITLGTRVTIGEQK
jgi:DNA-directed RNA polymerase beta subunit/intein/homing endonuclease